MVSGTNDAVEELEPQEFAREYEAHQRRGKAEATRAP